MICNLFCYRVQKCLGLKKDPEVSNVSLEQVPSSFQDLKISPPTPPKSKSPELIPFQDLKITPPTPPKSKSPELIPFESQAQIIEHTSTGSFEVLE
jgi:hypothetical protein